jgi:hypothetical protein
MSHRDTFVRTTSLAMKKNVASHVFEGLREKVAPTLVKLSRTMAVAVN